MRKATAAAAVAVARLPASARFSAAMAAGVEEAKPWRLSASLVVLAPAGSVPSGAAALPPKGGDHASRRSGRDFDYRVCCVRRAAKSSFMPDTMVFPGGAVESADVDTARELFGVRGDNSLDAAVRCAAIREAFEESGVAVFKPTVLEKDAEALAQSRTGICNDASRLPALCRALGVLPDIDSLNYWCSFITPDMEHVKVRRGGFDTRFYVYCATGTEDVRQASADNSETVQLLWLTPDEALAAVFEGTLTMVPPQFYILTELAENCRSMESVADHASSAARALQRDHPIKPYLVPLTEEERSAFLRRQGEEDGNVFSLCFPGDEAHPVFPGPASARHRMLMVGQFGRRMKMELERRGEVSLPITPAMRDWYTLAKL